TCAGLVNLEMLIPGRRSDVVGRELGSSALLLPCLTGLRVSTGLLELELDRFPDAEDWKDLVCRTPPDLAHLSIRPYPSANEPSPHKAAWGNLELAWAAATHIFWPVGQQQHRTKTALSLVACLGFGVVRLAPRRRQPGGRDAILARPGDVARLPLDTHDHVSDAAGDGKTMFTRFLMFRSEGWLKSWMQPY
ncbi:hypothetical protein HK405_000313, partial [Cladochytrium tenue]